MENIRFLDENIREEEVCDVEEGEGCVNNQQNSEEICWFVNDYSF